MNELWLIYIAIFCAVLLAVQGVLLISAQTRRSREAVNRRLIVARQHASAEGALEALKRERGIVGLENESFESLNRLVVQSGLKIDAKVWIAVGFILGVFLFIVFGLFLDYGVIAFVAAMGGSVLLLLLVLVIVRQRRLARFSDQLPDALDVIVRGVKSGYPFTVALNLVAKEMPDPIGTEFGMTSDEISFGSSLDISLDQLYRRVGHEELLFFAMAVKIQNETGGNLAEILSRLSRLIRERMVLRLKVKALSAEGRLSAVVLSIFPFALIGIINLINHDFYNNQLVRNSPVAVPAIIIGLTLLAIGNFIIYRMVRFKV